MALTTKRIINLPTQNDPQSGDYLAIDNGTNGTHKIPVGSVGVELDDTLTEQGKAADAKATGDAIDEIRSQLEVTGTASGAIATFSDGSTMPAKSVVVNIEPVQSGSGTPSPDNVRPISGWESVSVNVTNKNLLSKIKTSGTASGVTYTAQSDGSIKAVGTSTGTYPKYIWADGKHLPAGNYIMSAGDEVTANGVRLACAIKRVGGNTQYYECTSSTERPFTVYTDDQSMSVYMRTNGGSTAINATVYPMIRLASDTDPTYEPYTGITTTVNLGRTVYGGTLDVVSGVLTAYPFYPSYNGETLNGRWICDRAVYAEGTTPPTGSQVALISGTGTTYQLTPTEIQTLLGDNNVWADSGDVEVVYVRDLNITINNLLNSNGTRSLGMMMSAPTEAPTDEQTEEPAEDDMR